MPISSKCPTTSTFGTAIGISIDGRVCLKSLIFPFDVLLRGSDLNAVNERGREISRGVVLFVESASLLLIMIPIRLEVLLA
jgi:hypothetical protein